ncbi:hypothetical protein QQF64_019262 [Cirrhinus molitorella]|uniref:Uncharacterized protein n=1 Tax=Cirrhinus molitorella TaxID=172907 RepID=A0ABR3LEZ6_9TELE
MSPIFSFAQHLVIEKSGVGSVMIWECFSKAGIGHICLCEGGQVSLLRLRRLLAVNKLKTKQSKEYLSIIYITSLASRGLDNKHFYILQKQSNLHQT